MSSASDLHGIVKQIRRLVNDRVVSGTATRSDLEIPMYASDGLAEIEEDYPEFTSYVISGNGIAPSPDTIDKRLIALKAAQLITYEDWRENAGDAIAIQTGTIRLDTSKGTRFFKELYEALSNSYNNMVDNLNINGKTGTSIGGTRVDNYVEDLNSVRNTRSLL